MRKRERAAVVQGVLERAFPHPKIPLKHSDPFTLLVAVLLSAQCTDERVNQVTPQLFKVGGTPQKMAALAVGVVEEIIRPCGLFRSKAKNLIALSRILLEKHDGKVPRSLQSLMALPGVGRKTASVVLAQAFGIPAFPVDTHIHRCAKRWGLSQCKTVLHTEGDLKRLFQKESWIKLHLQIILFARAYCPARGHKKEKCPLCSIIKG